MPFIETENLVFELDWIEGVNIFRLKVDTSEFRVNTRCYEDILYNITVSQESQRALHKSIKGPRKVIFYNIEPDTETVINVTSHDDNKILTSETQPEASPNIGMLSARNGSEPVWFPHYSSY